MTARVFTMAPPHEWYVVDEDLNYGTRDGQTLKPHRNPRYPDVPYGRLYINGKPVKTRLDKELELAKEYEKCRGEYDVRAAWYEREKLRKQANSSKSRAPGNSAASPKKDLEDLQAEMRWRIRLPLLLSTKPRWVAVRMYRAGQGIDEITKAVGEPEWRVRRWIQRALETARKRAAKNPRARFQ